MDTVQHLPPPAPPAGADETRSRPTATHDALGQHNSVSGAAWLAAVGSGLLLVASVVVVAGRWEAISPVARFAGLVGSLFAVAFAAEAGRQCIRWTSTSLAVLAACLVAPVGIAAAATLEATWPVCILVGGTVALAATEIQSRRWAVRPLKAATAVAVILAAAGLAALVEVPATLFVAAASLAALALGARRRSASLAAAVAVSPLLEISARAGLGPGTLERIGVVGPTLWWSVPLSCSVAAATVAIRAQREHSASMAATAAAIGSWGCIAGLTAAEAGITTWLLIPTALVLLGEVSSLVADRSIFSVWGERLSAWLTPLLGVVGTLVPVAAIISTPIDAAALASYLTPIAAAAAVLIFATATTRRRPFTDRTNLSATMSEQSWMAALVPLGAAGAAISVLPLLGLGLEWLAVAALASWVVTSAVTSWKTWIPTTIAHAAWALSAVLAATDAAPVWTVSIVLAASAMLLAAFACTTNRYAHFIGVPSTVLLATTTVSANLPSNLAAVAATLGVVAVAATAMAMSSPRFGPSDALALSTGALSLGVALFTAPASVSLTLVLVSGQGWLYAVARNRADFAAVGAATGLGAIISLWWTTGTNQLAIESLAPFGIDGQDLALGAASIALLLGGMVLRTIRRLSSWLTDGPGLGVAISWLLMSQPDMQGGWATIAALTVGIAAIAVGGSTRRAAPLVMGTAAIGATLVISAGPRLAEAPTWAWIAAGGVALLTTAALIERTDRPLAGVTSEHDPDSLYEMFCSEFE